MSADLSPTTFTYRPLTGGSAVWIFMGVEVVTFGLFLLAHAWDERVEPAVYASSQALLHPLSALRGTILLLLGSGAAYLGVLANAAADHRHTARYLAAAAALGGLFAVNKIAEYADPALAAVTLSTNRFWFSYLFLTALHLLHVIAVAILLTVISWRAWRGDYGPERALTVEASATCWHLIDGIWVLIFPILYLM